MQHFNINCVQTVKKISRPGIYVFCVHIYHVLLFEIVVGCWCAVWFCSSKIE